MMWHVKTKHLGKTMFVGRFETEEQAIGNLRAFHENNADQRLPSGQAEKLLQETERHKRPEALTAEIVRNLLNYDPKTGILSWKNHAIHRGKRLKPGSVAGWVKKEGDREFICVSIGDKVYTAHRIAWLHYHGKPPTQKIYHLNKIGTDNRISNLVYKSWMQKKVNQ